MKMKAIVSLVVGYLLGQRQATLVIKPGAVNPLRETYSSTVASKTYSFGNYIYSTNTVTDNITSCLLKNVGCSSAYSGSKFTKVGLQFSVATTEASGFQEVICLQCTAPSGTLNYDNLKFELQARCQDSFQLKPGQQTLELVLKYTSDSSFQTGFSKDTYFKDTNPLCPASCSLQFQNNRKSLVHPTSQIVDTYVWLGSQPTYQLIVNRAVSDGFKAQLIMTCGNGVAASASVGLLVTVVPNCLTKTSLVPVAEKIMTYTIQTDYYMIRSARGFFSVGLFTSCTVNNCKLLQQGCVNPWPYTSSSLEGIYIDSNDFIWAPTYSRGFISTVCVQCTNIDGDVFSNDNWKVTFVGCPNSVSVADFPIANQFKSYLQDVTSESLAVWTNFFKNNEPNRCPNPNQCTLLDAGCGSAYSGSFLEITSTTAPFQIRLNRNFSPGWQEVVCIQCKHTVSTASMTFDNWLVRQHFNCIPHIGNNTAAVDLKVDFLLSNVPSQVTKVADLFTNASPGNCKFGTCTLMTAGCVKVYDSNKIMITDGSSPPAAFTSKTSTTGLNPTLYSKSNQQLGWSEQVCIICEYLTLQTFRTDSITVTQKRNCDPALAGTGSAQVVALYTLSASPVVFSDDLSSLFDKDYFQRCAVGCELRSTNDCNLAYTGQFTIATTKPWQISGIANVENGYIESVCLRCTNEFGQVFTKPELQLRQIRNCMTDIKLKPPAQIADLTIPYANTSLPYSVGNIFSSFFVNQNPADCPIIECKLLASDCVGAPMSFVTVSSSSSLQAVQNIQIGYSQSNCILCRNQQQVVSHRWALSQAENIDCTKTLVMKEGVKPKPLVYQYLEGKEQELVGDATDYFVNLQERLCGHIYTCKLYENSCTTEFRFTDHLFVKQAYPFQIYANRTVFSGYQYTLCYKCFVTGTSKLPPGGINSAESPNFASFNNLNIKLIPVSCSTSLLITSTLYLNPGSNTGPFLLPVSTISAWFTTFISPPYNGTCFIKSFNLFTEQSLQQEFQASSLKMTSDGLLVDTAVSTDWIKVWLAAVTFDGAKMSAREVRVMVCGKETLKVKDAVQPLLVRFRYRSSFQKVEVSRFADRFESTILECKIVKYQLEFSNGTAIGKDSVVARFDFDWNLIVNTSTEVNQTFYLHAITVSGIKSSPLPVSLTVVASVFNSPTRLNFAPQFSIEPVSPQRIIIDDQTPYDQALIPHFVDTDFIYKLPRAEDVFGDIANIRVETKPEFMDFENSRLEVTRVKMPRDLGNHVVNVTLVDSFGVTTRYSIVFIVEKSNPDEPLIQPQVKQEYKPKPIEVFGSYKCRITSISATGLVLIEFANQNGTSENVNISQSDLVNTSYIQISLHPFSSDFNWTIAQIEPTSLALQLNFHEPLLVSRWRQRDTVQVRFGVGDRSRRLELIEDRRVWLMVHQDYQVVTGKIRKQLPKEGEYLEMNFKMVETLLTIAQLIGLLLSILVPSTFKYWLLFVTQLQLIAHLGMVPINYPASASLTFQKLLPPASLNFLFGFEQPLLQLLTRLKVFREWESNKDWWIPDQLQDLGYSSCYPWASFIPVLVAFAFLIFEVVITTITYLFLLFACNPLKCLGLRSQIKSCDDKFQHLSSRLRINHFATQFLLLSNVFYFPLNMLVRLMHWTNKDTHVVMQSIGYLSILVIYSLLPGFLLRFFLTRRQLRQSNLINRQTFQLKSPSMVLLPSNRKSLKGIISSSDFLSDSKFVLFQAIWYLKRILMVWVGVGVTEEAQSQVVVVVWISVQFAHSCLLTMGRKYQDSAFEKFEHALEFGFWILICFLTAFRIEDTNLIMTYNLGFLYLAIPLFQLLAVCLITVVKVITKVRSKRFRSNAKHIWNEGKKTIDNLIKRYQKYKLERKEIQNRISHVQGNQNDISKDFSFSPWMAETQSEGQAEQRPSTQLVVINTIAKPKGKKTKKQLKKRRQRKARGNHKNVKALRPEILVIDNLSSSMSDLPEIVILRPKDRLQLNGEVEPNQLLSISSISEPKIKVQPVFPPKPLLKELIDNAASNIQPTISKEDFDEYMSKRIKAMGTFDTSNM